jgi:curli biogenesis system outer membrane secretion channel CsgG
MRHALSAFLSVAFLAVPALLRAQAPAQPYYPPAATAAATPTASGPLPSIFVAPLTGDLAQIQGWQPALGEGLAEMIITKLTQSGRFEVLESTNLNDLVGEIKLGEDGYVGGGEAVQKGGFAGADYMFVGKVTRFGSKAQNVNLGGFVPGSGGGLGIKSSTSDVQINWRIVDAATRVAKASGSAVGKETGLGFDVAVAVDGHGGNIGFGNQEFMNSALGKATVKALDAVMIDVMRTPLPVSGRRQQLAASAAAKAEQAAAAATALKKTPGKVLAAPGGGIVILSIGTAQGWNNGDKIKIYEAVEIKNSTGEVVFTEKKLRGEATLEDVQEKSSKARVPEDIKATEGWIVQWD